MNLKDRIIISTILPVEGKFEELIIAQDIHKKIDITQEELAKYNIKTQENGGLTWSQNDDEFDIELSESEKAFIGKKLKALSDKEKLTSDMVPLYKLYVS